MAFSEELKLKVNEYINKHHPNEEWWRQYFDTPFVADTDLANRLVQEMMAIRSIYQLLEGLRVENKLLRAQAKIQIITYASVYEAVLHCVIFQTGLKDTSHVKNLLSQDKYVKRSLPEPYKNIVHCEENIYTMAKVEGRRDERYIKFEEILSVAKTLELIDDSLHNNLLELYNLRNAIHLQAEIKKGVVYELEISQKAHKLLKPFKRQIIEGLKRHKIVDRRYNVRFSRKEIISI